MHLPPPRGPVTVELGRVLDGQRGRLPVLRDRAEALAADAAASCSDVVLAHEDLQLALLELYELHYTGLDGVDPDWEWSPELLGVRGMLEIPLEAALRAVARVPASSERDVPSLLRRLTADDDTPSLSGFLARHASAQQFREFVTHRSLYELKEADPHSWAIPRLSGRAKAALVEIQVDEYGGGRADRMHSALFARAMRALGLDDRPGSLLDSIPALTLATVNAMSLLGLHRRLRGAVVGHLAAFEMTSTVPNRRYATGLRRLGYGENATCFFDEHVEADAVHEQVAAHDLAGGLVEEEPDLLPDVLFGAAVAQELERRFSCAVLAAWTVGASSLRSRDAGVLGEVV